jgi:hypothetical protein
VSGGWRVQSWKNWIRSTAVHRFVYSGADCRPIMLWIKRHCACWHGVVGYYQRDTDSRRLAWVIGPRTQPIEPLFVAQ